MSTTEPTKLRVVVQIRDADNLKFDVTSETMMFEAMDLIEEAIGVKPYQQCLRLGFPGVVVVDGTEDNDDLARTLGEVTKFHWHHNDLNSADSVNSSGPKAPGFGSGCKSSPSRIWKRLGVKLQK